MNDVTDHNTSQKKPNLPELREWINALVGVSALLLALVSFWTTARISGLEGYLRSELSRRNTDLDKLAERAAQIERLAIEREEQLAQLDGATREIVASSISAQALLSEAQARLSNVEAEVSTARYQLASTERALDSVASDFRGQTEAFDLFRRRQSFEYATLQLAVQSLSLFEQPTGAKLVSEIANIPEPTRQNEIKRYIGIIKEDFGKVCPDFMRRIPSLPDRLKNPGLPLNRVLRDSRSPPETQTDLEKWQKQYSEYLASDRAYTDARNNAISSLIEDAENCMCRTLSTDGYSPSQICPGI